MQASCQLKLLTSHKSLPASGNDEYETLLSVLKTLYKRGASFQHKAVPLTEAMMYGAFEDVPQSRRPSLMPSLGRNK